MKLEDIKVGETYNVRVTVKYIDGYDVVAATIRQDEKEGYRTRFHFEDIPAFSPITPETAPKYDPSRKFRKGDKVRVVEWNGRDIARVGQIGYVVSDEYNSRVELGIDGWKNSVYYPACHLELVTPVEELERYIIIHNKNNKYYEVCWKDDDEPDGRTGRTRCRTTFWYHHPPQTYSQKEAAEAAEAERDRMNADYRKEQK